MTRQNLENILKNGIPRASLFYGDAFWIGFYGEKITEMHEDQIAKFYFADYDFTQVLDLLAQSSLFGDRTLVVLKLDKKLSKKEIQSFLKALEGNPSNALLVEFYRSDSRSVGDYARDFREMAACFKGDGVVEVRFFEPSQSEALKLLEAQARRLGIQIQTRNLDLLLGIQNGNVGLALKELEKFVCFDHAVTSQEIHALCSPLGNLEVDDLISALFARKDTLQIYARLEEEGVDEMSALSSLGSHFYKLFLFFAYIRSHGRADAKEILGYTPPSFVVDQLVRQAMSLREGQYKAVFEVLVEWRLKIFAGKGKICNAIVALQKIQEILR